MSILICHNIKLEIAGKELLENINFRVEKSEKVGLIGANGAGKTTLLKVIMGDLPPQAGQIDCPVPAGYLPQTTPDVAGHGTVFESLLAEREDILGMRNDLRILEIRMTQEAEDMDRETESKILKQYGVLTENYEAAGGYELEARIRRILSGLGLEQEIDIARLSGGQKTRLALGKLLLKQPELLILDEPTNHLDLEALEWLEEYLQECRSAVLVVSHDRYFLDRVVNKILLIQNGQLKQYPGNYTGFELQRALEEKTMAGEARRVNKKIAELQEYIRRYRAGIKAGQARGREIQLGKLSPPQVRQVPKALKLNFGPTGRTGDMVMSIESLTVSFGPKTIFAGVNLELRRGDRIALLGKNGAGKTSLLRAVMGKVSYSGTVKFGANVKIGYYSQEHEDIGWGENVLAEIRNTTGLDEFGIRNTLARFGFRGDDVLKPLNILSGGEKSRLALCKLFLSQGNLLLLDEPTNHLDMETREVLEEALREYDGTILTVSHDRYFLDRLVTKIAVLAPNGVRLREGDYSTYKEIEKNEVEKNKINKESAEEADGGGQFEFQPAKNYRQESKNNRRKERKVQQLEEQIGQTEAGLHDLQKQMDSATDYELVLKLHGKSEKLQAELEDLMEEWLEICGE